MPLYDYRCKQCNEVMQYNFPMTDYPKEVACEYDCSGTATRIISGNPHSLFKTTGFTKLGTHQTHSAYNRRKRAARKANERREREG
jgi:putative FmdB family regulatory protein